MPCSEATSMDEHTWQELRLLATSRVRGLGANPSASVEPQVTAADNLTAAWRRVLSQNHPDQPPPNFGPVGMDRHWRLCAAPR